MPHILVRIPKHAYPAPQRAALVRQLNQAAATAEHIPALPRHRQFCWVIVDEVEPDAWTCGGVDATAQLLPCLAEIHLPAGVLDAAGHAAYIALVHEAFREALPADDTRQLATSVVLHEVADGNWGINGGSWRLPDFARAAGFAHLQGLVHGA